MRGEKLHNDGNKNDFGAIIAAGVYYLFEVLYVFGLLTPN